MNSAIPKRFHSKARSEKALNTVRSCVTKLETKSKAVPVHAMKVKYKWRYRPTHS